MNDSLIHSDDHSSDTCVSYNSDLSDDALSEEDRMHTNKQRKLNVSQSTTEVQ